MNDEALKAVLVKGDATRDDLQLRFESVSKTSTRCRNKLLR